MPGAQGPGPIYPSDGDGQMERSDYPVPFQPPGSRYRPGGDGRMDPSEGPRIPVPQTDYNPDGPESGSNQPRLPENPRAALVDPVAEVPKKEKKKNKKKKEDEKAHPTMAVTCAPNQPGPPPRTEKRPSKNERSWFRRYLCCCW
ncbi:hypothetical protein FRC04_012166 [Tulasnella sp. 424]|nr:hypothetical protein FRC04_012166 [Tulasnella sp. 424]